MQSSEIPRREPPEARAGLTWQWRREDLATDYPATGWTLKYYFKQMAVSGANFSITAAADGVNFAVNNAATASQGYTAGKYSWAAVVTGGTSEAYEVDRGTMVVLPRIDTATALDERTHERKVLDALETALENKALLTPDQMEYTIGNRHLKRMSYPELIAARDVYRSKVTMQEMAERARNGQGGNRVVWKL
jgi:hypothetical protein